MPRLDAGSAQVPHPAQHGGHGRVTPLPHCIAPNLNPIEIQSLTKNFSSFLGYKADSILSASGSV